MKKLIFLCSIFSCLILNAQTTNRGAGVVNSTTANSGGTTHVVLIGVSDYAFLPQDQQLDFADDDAQLFHDYLKTWGDLNFKIFLNEEAGKVHQVGMELQNTLLNEAQSGDKVILFFAGHGDVDQIYGDGYLLLNQVKPSSNNTYKFNEALSLNELRQMIDLADKNGVEVTLIADACRSGSVLTADANTMMSGITKNAITMISCQHDEFSEESIKYGNGHGVFTYFLIQGLMGLADSDDNKTITLLELQNYVQAKVMKERDDQQTPDFKGKLSKEVATVDEKLLAEARKQDNLSLAIVAMGKKKAVSEPECSVSAKCQSLMQHLMEQTLANKFFNDELDQLDQQTLAIGQAQSRKKTHATTVYSVVVSAGGKYTATASDGGVVLFSKQDTKNALALNGETKGVRFLDFDPTGKRLATAKSSGLIELWDLSTKAKLDISFTSAATPSVVKFISSSMLAVGNEKGSIQLFDLEAGTSKSIKCHKGAVKNLDYHHPYIFSCGGDGKIVKTDILTRTKIATISAHEGAVNDIKYLALSSSLVTVGDDGLLKRWSLASLKEEAAISIFKGPALSIAVDPFEKFCFVGNPKEKKAGVVDLSTRRALKSKLANTTGVASVSYDPVNYTLVIGELDGSVNFQRVKINPDLNAAVDLHRQLMECGDLAKVKYKIDGTLIIGLNNAVSEVLNPLVNGEENTPSLEEIKKAIRYAKKALELGKDYAADANKLEINLLLLEVYEVLKSGDKSVYSATLKKIQRIEELDPNGAYAYNVAAQLYLAMNNLEKAKEAVLKAEALAPKWSETTNTSGEVAAKLGDNATAEMKFKETISKSPDMMKGYENLGLLYVKQNRLNDAKRILEQALELDSTKASVNDLYFDVLAKIQEKETPQKTNPKATSKTKIEQYGDVFKNTVFYYGYQNRIKFLDDKWAVELFIKTDDATMAKRGAEYMLAPKKTSKTITIEIYESASGALLGTKEVPARNMPQPQLFWGKSKVDEKLDLSARVFVFGYKNEPDLDNMFYKIIGYEVLFVDDFKASSGGEFNPSNNEPGMMTYSGNGPDINNLLLDEIKRRRDNVITGKICVAATVESPQGVRYKTSACFWY
jgi:tetratricopeptide (TPR) repeat protein